MRLLYRALLSLRRRIQHGASAVKQILQDQSWCCSGWACILFWNRMRTAGSFSVSRHWLVFRVLDEKAVRQNWPWCGDHPISDAEAFHTGSYVICRCWYSCFLHNYFMKIFQKMIDFFIPGLYYNNIWNELKGNSMDMDMTESIRLVEENMRRKRNTSPSSRGELSSFCRNPASVTVLEYAGTRRDWYREVSIK